MKLEQQVTSLEISKRLKELGVKQESFFDWECKMGNWSLVWGDYHVHPYVDTSDLRQYASAFTVAELGEMLPLGVRANKNGKGSIRGTSYFYYQEEENIGYSTYGYEGREDDLFESLDVTATTEADARGKMLIYLLENKLITL